MNRDGQLDNAQVRTEVSPGLRHLGDEEPTDLTSQLDELLPGESVQVAWAVNRLENAHCASLDQRPQNILEDAAVPVVVGLTRCVDANHRVELDRALACWRVLSRFGHHVHRLRDAALVQFGQAGDADLLGSVEPEGLPALTSRELERDDTHADEVRPVNPLEALSDDRLDAQQAGPLGGPVTR